MKPHLHRTGKTYDVIGKTGSRAGLLGPINRRRGWVLMMFGCPKEHFARFVDARRCALAFAQAIDLGRALLRGLDQGSFSIVAKDRTEWFSRRPEDQLSTTVAV